MEDILQYSIPDSGDSKRKTGEVVAERLSHWPPEEFSGSEAKHSQLRRSTVRRAQAWLLTHVVPEAFLYPLWRRYKAPYFERIEKIGRKVIDIQDHVWVEVYWNKRPEGGEVGPGPTASVYVFEEEVLRLDCFGGRQGHFHINPRQVLLAERAPARLCFPEGSYQDNFAEAAFQLENNLPAMLTMNRIGVVRSVKLDDARLARTAELVHEIMLDLVAQHEAELVIRTAH